MRYLPLNKNLFIENRQKFIKHLEPKSLAIFNSNDIMPTNADGTMPFRQNTDLFYLTGIDQEESILLIFPDSLDDIHQEVLFLKETNEEIAIWEGEKLTKEKAKEVSGIEQIYWLEDFPKVFHKLTGLCDNIYLNTNEHSRASIEVETRDARFIKWCKTTYPMHNYNKVSHIMHHLRAIKSPEEIKQLQRACDITEKGFRRILNFIKPNIMEFNIEAELLHEFINNRSRGFAYEPIIASGFNACVLHYIDNSAPCKDGDLILMDFGAEYANYKSDLTRCVPVNGKFSPRQKEVYNAVLRIQKAAIDMLKVGNQLDDYHKAVGEVTEKELVDLGLLSMEDIKNQDPDMPAYKKYFMHGTSHYLGLDVHDYGDWYRKFEAGMVFTCEPGIYIREESLGIRIENDLVITEEGNIDLMQNIPREVEEIEELMNK